MKNISNNKIVWGVVGLIVGLVIGWFIGSSGPSTSADSKEIINDDSQEELELSATVDRNEKISDALFTNSSLSQESDSAILVNDQGAGSVVTVASVETDASVWVVVREDKDGVVGNILGASRVDSGASNNIVVNLLRPTIAGQTYRIVLFRDNGDSLFDYKVDVPMTSEGVLISRPFTVSFQ